MKAIVAADRNWGIGYQNRLLVSIPSDMKFFRQTTTGHVVVMGRKTLESFPNGLPLKNRTNIVLTANKDYAVKDAIIVHSEKELYRRDLCDRRRKRISYDASIFGYNLCNKDRPCISGGYIFPESG